VTTCGSGVTACALAFGLHLLGWPDAAIYDGSWAEWGLPGDTPVATGEE
jgi:thiosulfate/3-mercaptopyruvate sulfurtransferase